MKRRFLLLLIAAALTAACEESAVYPADGLIFEFSVNHPEVDTKAVKGGWTAGDRVFVFFSGTAESSYLEMSYDGSVWQCQPFGGLTLDESKGTMTAVYQPFSGVPSRRKHALNVNGGNYSAKYTELGTTVGEVDYMWYLVAENVPYEIKGRVVYGTLDMRFPEFAGGKVFAQFFIPDVAASEAEHMWLSESGLRPAGLDYVAADGAAVPVVYGEKVPVRGHAWQGGVLFSGVVDASRIGTASAWAYEVYDNDGRRPFDYTVRTLVGERAFGYAAVALPPFSRQWSEPVAAASVRLATGPAWYLRNVAAADGSFVEDPVGVGFQGKLSDARPAVPSGWRIPGKDDMKDLYFHCTWEYTAAYGNPGVLLAGPTGVSLFLPLENGSSPKANYWTTYETSYGTAVFALAADKVSATISSKACVRICSD